MKATSKSSTVFLSVQYLRGIAAIVVLLAHIPNDLPLAFNRAFRGGIGVDLFFIISGFVMAATISGQAQGPMAALRFLLRRIVRILPLYALATLMFAGVAFLLSRNPVDWRHLALSITTFPFSGESGAVREPLLFVGWSLSFESFFYLSLTGLLCVGLASWQALATVFCALFIWGQVSPPQSVLTSFITAPIILEFIIGLAIHEAWQRWSGWLIPRRKPLLIWGAVLFFLAMKGYDGDPHGLMPKMEVSFFGSKPIWRALAWGLPSFLLFIGFLSYEDQFRLKPLRFLGWIGDASYSLYLFHPTVIMLLTPVLGIRFYPFTFVYLAVPLFVSFLIYQYVEKPLIFLGKTGLKILGIEKLTKAQELKTGNTESGAETGELTRFKRDA